MSSSDAVPQELVDDLLRKFEAAKEDAAIQRQRAEDIKSRFQQIFLFMNSFDWAEFNHPEKAIKNLMELVLSSDLECGLDEYIEYWNRLVEDWPVRKNIFVRTWEHIENAFGK
ncbi:MAG: hypothetical protein V3T23_02155 [Nitrososphaerales archaeon]